MWRIDVSPSPLGVVAHLVDGLLIASMAMSCLMRRDNLSAVRDAYCPFFAGLIVAAILPFTRQIPSLGSVGR